ncbi:hypothetical protein OIO90_000875 [Microbotryomycetes sp. JL221]|nr:hypothetical protein OIO90_000875 [Microbotryomycetes sp. JL221]
MSGVQHHATASSSRHQHQPQPSQADHDGQPRSASDPISRKSKKKRAGRGRLMMVKVFYSLMTPRVSPPARTTAVPTVTLQSQASAYSPTFLDVVDPALAPSPAPSQAESDRGQQNEMPTRYNYLARLSTPVWVQLVGSAPSQTPGEDKIEFGKLTLKTCLSAICISRPEFVADPSRDYAVSAVDPYESSLQSSQHQSTSTSPPPPPGQGLMEGKGMLSWNLAEKREGTTFVNGRVALSEREKERRLRKRRRLDDRGHAMNEEEDEDSDDDEATNETLEVWLQLAERPSFTQTQFLTSLRSFANPSPHQVATDRPVEPAPLQGRSGDPVKRKRPREAERTASTGTFVQSPANQGDVSTPPLTSAAKGDAVAPLDQTALTQLQDPRIRALLAQVIPSLASPDSGSAAPVISLDSEQGRQLLPAIRTLAQYYGVALPSGDLHMASNTASSSSGSQNVQTGPSAAKVAQQRNAARDGDQIPAPTRRKTGSNAEEYIAVEQSGEQSSDKTNPRDPKNGCSNCRRKKSTVWRERESNREAALVCNACGVFFNRNGFHRRQIERSTSPVRSQTSATSSKPKTGRSLQGRLTATCEADLKKIRSQHTMSKPGIVPPLSPSKVVGPHRSPGTMSAWGQRPTLHHIMTSPGRSPARRRAPGLMAATSPVRSGPGRNSKSREVQGLRSGFDSGGGQGRGSRYDISANLFGSSYSPSPEKPRNVPSFLLTDSPGTALNRILSDTNVAMDGIDMADKHTSADPSMAATHAPAQSASRNETNANDHDDKADNALGEFFNQFKENNPPVTDDFFDRLIDPSLLPPQDAQSRQRDALTTDFTATDAFSHDPLLSSLRRGFDRMSSNQLTAPSSPIPSSPCVLPRTSSATPGQKGKAPESCGRPAPSIHDSFIDGLVPAVMQHVGPFGDGETPVSDSDAYTPASAFAGTGGDRSRNINDDDRTMMFDHFGGGMATGAHFFRFDGNLTNSMLNAFKTNGANETTASVLTAGDSSRQAQSYSFLPPHLTATSDAPTDFDIGSLPPSSPPQLPSEVFPTPSDFDSNGGPSPDGDESNNSGPKPIDSWTLPTEAQVHSFMHTLASTAP